MPQQQVYKIEHSTDIYSPRLVKILTSGIKLTKLTIYDEGGASFTFYLDMPTMLTFMKIISAELKENETTNKVKRG